MKCHLFLLEAPNIHSRDCSMSLARRVTTICVCAMLGSLHFQLARSAPDTECNRLLKLHLPKVALMFLVRTDSHHTEIWTKWLAQLRNKVPSALACSSSAMHCFRHQSTLLASTNAVYHQQHFFSIYVHTRPEAPDFPPDHLFHGRVITDRVPTAWGAPSLAVAHKLLLTAALQDELNQQFHLLCDTVVPLHPPLYTYTQLIGHHKSRISVFHHTAPRTRYSKAMEHAWSGMDEHAVGHTQWVTLNRKHAEIVRQDQTMIDLFQQYCHQDRHAWCIADEQYIGTLLSNMTNVADECNYAMATIVLRMGVSGVTRSDMYHNPVDYILELRGGLPTQHIHPPYGAWQNEWHGTCQPTEEAYRPQLTLQHLRAGQNVTMCNSPDDMPVLHKEIKLFTNCFLFARKFSLNSSATVQNALEEVGVL